MKSDYNAYLAQNICSNEFTLSYGAIENDFFQDIIPKFYKYLSFINDKNNFSLVSKKWCAISDDDTKIISIYKKYYNAEGLFSISQRFKFVEKFQISTFEECDKLNCLEFMGIEKEIKSIDEGIKYFNNLTYLDLSHNFTITDDCIKNLTNLKVLFLDGNDNISDVGIQNFTNLTELYCGNYIGKSTLTDKLTNLTKLDIQDSFLISGNDLINLTNLKSLTSSSFFEDSDFVNFTNLCELDCTYSVRVTASGISHLTNLISLKLNPYEDFHDLTLNGFTKLTSLKGYATDGILVRLPNLQTLALYNTTEVSAYGIKSLI